MLEPASGTTETIQINGGLLSVHRFHAHLRAWGVEHQRIFPWRTTDNPFHILIAELMLRRTQARQVVPVYNQFIARYPDAQTLAGALPEEVARVLFPLGLAWRVPAFQQMARVLVAEHDGQVPTGYETLLALPGIGDYVASTVCSFALGRPFRLSTRIRCVWPGDCSASRHMQSPDVGSPFASSSRICWIRIIHENIIIISWISRRSSVHLLIPAVRIVRWFRSVRRVRRILWAIAS